MKRRLAQGVVGAILVVAPVSGLAVTAHASEYGGIGILSTGHTYVFNPEFREGLADVHAAFGALDEGGFDLGHHDKIEALRDFDHAFDLVDEAETDFFGSSQLVGHFE